ncbi:MAG TPA: hypothetical protein VGQ03_08625 [Nitrososphaera sp.]|jgi:hypothetical protein|nr:hypothetical protein [Nitrososphaera sp.]
MPNTRRMVTIVLASATLVVCIVNAIGNVAVLFKLGPTPVLSIAGMALAAATFAVSWNIKSLLIPSLLALSGIIFMIPGLAAMGFSFDAIVFPGPILGVVFGLVIFALAITKILRAILIIPPPKIE